MVDVLRFLVHMYTAELQHIFFHICKIIIENTVFSENLKKLAGSQRPSERALEALYRHDKALQTPIKAPSVSFKINPIKSSPAMPFK